MDDEYDFGLPEPTELGMNLVHSDKALWARMQYDDERLRDYERRYKEDGVNALPPVTVFFDGQTYWLADGFHRAQAAYVLQRVEGPGVKMPVLLYNGSERDARLFACSANTKHGLSLTNAEKRRIIHRLLDDAEVEQWASNRIATFANVSAYLVAQVRHERLSLENMKIALTRIREDTQTALTRIRDEATIPDSETPADIPSGETKKPLSVLRGGQSYTMNTANIGKRPQTRPPAPVPSPTDCGAGYRGLMTAWNSATEQEQRVFLITIRACLIDEMPASEDASTAEESD